MGELPGHARSAYLDTIDIGTGCTSALPRGTLSTCRSDTPILGSGHMRLYPLDTVPTVVVLRVNDFVAVIGTDFAAVVVVICGGGGVAVVFYDVDNALMLVLHLPRVHIHQCSTI